MKTDATETSSTPVVDDMPHAALLRIQSEVEETVAAADAQAEAEARQRAATATRKATETDTQARVRFAHD